MHAVEQDPGVDMWLPRGVAWAQATPLADSTWVIYNHATAVAHVLNVTAGIVWEHCDGAHDRAALSDVLGEFFPDAAAEERHRAVAAILADFARVGLLADVPEDPAMRASQAPSPMQAGAPAGR